MTKEQEESDEFFERYRDHLSQVDELVHVVSLISISMQRWTRS
jgi:hypothetical protein